MKPKSEIEGGDFKGELISEHTALDHKVIMRRLSNADGYEVYIEFENDMVDFYAQCTRKDQADEKYKKLMDLD